LKHGDSSCRGWEQHSRLFLRVTQQRRAYDLHLPIRLERLEIRGRLLRLFEDEGFAQPNLWNGAQAFAVDPDELSQILAREFGVVLAPTQVPELLTMTWLVDLVERQNDGDLLVM
jgi:hypothetical protein